MMYATTRDFHTFSEPKVWNDPGYSVIDSTMIQHGGTYYRFTKDERNNPPRLLQQVHHRGEVADRGRPARHQTPQLAARRRLHRPRPARTGCEGPRCSSRTPRRSGTCSSTSTAAAATCRSRPPTSTRGNWKPSTDYALPASPRHGTVLPVTQAEYDPLLRAYQPDQFIASVDDITLRTTVGTPVALPATVTARYGDNTAKQATVTWNPVPDSAYGQAGTFTVEGTLGADVSAKAKATVIVSSSDNGDDPGDDRR